MKIISPRRDFIIVEDFFSSRQAAEWIQFVLDKGNDPFRGFHHPLLRPNRFHKAPRYPVKKYMCYGLYWNPMDYSYNFEIPEFGVKPYPLPDKILKISKQILDDFYPYPAFQAETVLVNFYTADSSMGIHVDKDEEDHEAPVIGLNFGSSCRFFYEDGEEIKEIKIPGNSIYIFGRTARLMRHGLGTIYSKSLAPGSEQFLKQKERINLTIRQVFKSGRNKS